ncbi:MAG: thiosulfate oxidation carrier protein SoxY, partial [Paracoccaceae bacterium]
LTRRDALALGLGTTAASFLPAPSGLPAQSGASPAQLIAGFTGGAPVASGQITLSTAAGGEISTLVAVSVSAPGAQAVLLVAPAQPEAVVARLDVPQGDDAPPVAVQMQLFAGQQITAVARLKDGSFIRTSQIVESAQPG